MPFRSEQQRKFLYAVHPKIAAEFAAETPAGTKLPKYAKDSKSKSTETRRKK